MGDLYSGSPGLSAGGGLWQQPTGLWGGNFGLSGPVSPQSVFGSSLIANWDLQTAPIHKDFVGRAAAVGDNVALVFDNASWNGDSLATVLARQTELRGNGTTGVVGTATAASYNTSTGAFSVSRVDASNQSYVTWTGLVPGAIYAVSIANVAGGNAAMRAGNQAALVIASILSGATGVIYVMASAGGAITLTSGLVGTATGTVTSFKLVPGYHAYQPSAGSQPKLASYPRCGVRNLLTYTEDFSNAVWPTSAATISSGGGDYTLTDNATNARHIVYQQYTAPSTAVYTFYVDAKQGTGRYINVSVGATGTTNFSIIVDLSNGTVTDTKAGASATNTGYSVTNVDGYYRIAVRCTCAAASNIYGIIGGSNSATPTYDGANNASYIGTGSTWRIKRAQLEVGSTATAYQTVTTAYSVTQAPYAQAYALVPDGVDDFMVTPSIDLSAYNKIAVYTAARKVSDAARGMVMELTASAAANNGAFGITAPNAASATLAFESKGTALTDAVASSQTAPLTAVLTGIGSIAGDSTILRVNGSQADQDTGDQGTGNYSSAALYLFMRGGSSLPFKGAFYGATIAAGITPSTSQTAWIEAQYSNLCRQS